MTCRQMIFKNYFHPAIPMLLGLFVVAAYLESAPAESRPVAKPHIYTPGTKFSSDAGGGTLFGYSHCPASISHSILPQGCIQLEKDKATNVRIIYPDGSVGSERWHTVSVEEGAAIVSRAGHGEVRLVFSE